MIVSVAACIVKMRFFAFLILNPKCMVYSQLSSVGIVGSKGLGS